MNRYINLPMIAAVTLLTLPGLATAKDWYLAPNGNDAGDCSIKETPCQTIQAVVAKTEFVAGDQLLLKTGSYDLKGKTGGWGSITAVVFEVYGGYNSDYSKRDNDPAKTVITDSSTSGNGRLFAFQTGHEQPIVFDGVKFADFTQHGTDSGLITTYNAGAWLKFNNVIFDHNTIVFAGAVDLTVADDLLEISNSAFMNNVSTNTPSGGIGALRLRAGTRTIIKDSIFTGNQVAVVGSTINVNNARLDLSSVTFYENQTTAGNAIYATGTNAVVNCVHCSLIGSAPSGTIVAIKVDNSAQFSLKNSIIAAENGHTMNIVNGGQLMDLGYNAFGLNGASGANISLPVHATSYLNNEANLSDLYLPDVDYYGGTIPSLKPVSKNSSLIDKIPNDVPALQTGDSPSRPFASLADAHNALTAYAHYDKKRYFFTINNKSFSTVVDKDGWVLVAAGTRLQSTGAYTEVTTLEEASDNILDRSILTDAGFVFDEVRITSRNLTPVAIDVRSSNTNVINAVKAFKMLPNNYDTASPYGRGGWYAVQGAQYVLNNTPAGSTLAGLPNGGTAADLNQVIYEATGKTDNGIFWAPAGANGHVETYQSTTGPRIVDFDLWVRSSASYCGGVVNTDQRGMPRPDYVNPNDPAQYGEVHDCDIGSFEWSNGYRIDCWDEDGERPENSITSSQTSFCIGDPRLLTPKAIMDNLGAMSWQYLLVLSSLLFWRFKNNKNKVGARS